MSSRFVRAAKIVRELRGVRDHQVRRGVLLDRPERVESERLRQIGQRQLLGPDLPVRDRRRPDLLAALQSLEPIPVPVVRE